jgi:hypothetical protein
MEIMEISEAEWAERKALRAEYMRAWRLLTRCAPPHSEREFRRLDRMMRKEFDPIFAKHPPDWEWGLNRRHPACRS